MIFNGLYKGAILKLFRAWDFNIVEIRKMGRHYMLCSSITLIPDINLLTPAQCYIGPGQDIDIR